MGVEDDFMVVVNNKMEVFGVENFRIVDVLIMLSIVSGNFNGLIIMMVEKVVDIILGILLFFKLIVLVYKMLEK